MAFGESKQQCIVQWTLFLCKGLTKVRALNKGIEWTVCLRGSGLCLILNLCRGMHMGLCKKDRTGGGGGGCGVRGNYLSTESTGDGGGEREREIQWEHKNQGERRGRETKQGWEQAWERARDVGRRMGRGQREGRWLPVWRISVPLRPVTLLHLHCSVTDRTRHSQEQPAKPGDQIILWEERFTLNNARPHLPTFSSPLFLPVSLSLTLTPSPSLLPEIWNRAILKTFLLNLKSQHMSFTPPPTHTQMCTNKHKTTLHTNTHLHAHSNMLIQNTASLHISTHRGENWDWEVEKKQVCVWAVAGRSALIQGVQEDKEEEEEKRKPSEERHQSMSCVTKIQPIIFVYVNRNRRKKCSNNLVKQGEKMDANIEIMWVCMCVGARSSHLISLILHLGNLSCSFMKADFSFL